MFRADCCLLFVVDRLLVCLFALLVLCVVCWPLCEASRCALPVVCCLLVVFIVCLLFVCCLLFEVCCVLFGVLVFGVLWSLFAACLLCVGCR